MPYIGQEPVAGNFVLLDAITTSATATYALTKNSVAYSPESSRNMIVSLNGVTQAPETAYTVSGSNITFSSALTASDVIDYILVLGDVLDIGRPSDGVVGTDQMNYPLGNFSSTGIDDNATSTAITIDSSQRVGIGTSSPFGELSIKSTSPQVYLETLANGNVQINFNETADQLDVMVNNSNGKIAFGTNSTERMRITSSGNVGIGTASPNSTASAGPTLEISGTAGGNLVLSDSNATSGQRAKYLLSQGGTLYVGHSADDGTSPVNDLVVDSSGNVGIGTTSPQRVLVLSKSDSTGVQTQYTNSTTGVGASNGFTVGIDGSENAELWNFQNTDMLFATNGTERMRIDSSGNLLVGKTSTAFGTAGVEASAGNGLWSTRSSLPALALNRLSTDGSIADFYKDGTAVGSIKCRSSGGNLQIDTVQSGIDFAGDGWLPMRNGSIVDNDLDLGSSSFRFNDIYATNATIQTSDANEKQDIEALSDAETRVAVAAKGLLRKFRWKSAVEEKGDDARIHFGIIAQDLQAAFEAEGLDAGRYAMFIHSTWTDEETGEERSRMGVRYSELLAFIIAAI